MKVAYDFRLVPAHDKSIETSVLLMNEAPGPEEAKVGVPLYGQQGANLYHALRNANIAWAVDPSSFTWPIKETNEKDHRHRQKIEFLALRARYLTCTNAYPYWPRPSEGVVTFCPPFKQDVLSDKNIERIRGEVTPKQSVILICGYFAYLACNGREIINPAEREPSELTEEEILTINERLNSNFKKGWYMGHTRRWSLYQQRTISCLREMAQFLEWQLS